MGWAGLGLLAAGMGEMGARAFAYLGGIGIPLGLRPLRFGFVPVVEIRGVGCGVM